MRTTTVCCSTLVPANPHTRHTDTSTPLPGFRPIALLCLPLHCLFAAKPDTSILSTDQTSGSTLPTFDPADATLLFFLPLSRTRTRTHTHNSHSTHTYTHPKQRDSGADPSIPFIYLLSVINKATLLRDPSLSIRRPPGPPLHLFASSCQSQPRLDSLDSLDHTRSVSAPQLYLPTSFHAGQADGRETLSILEYLADTRARAYPRRKESRHRPGPFLPRHLLQPTVYPADRPAGWPDPSPFSRGAC